MKRLAQDLLIVFIPVITVLCLVNFLGDPAHIFDSNYENRLVNMMQDKYAITNTDNCDERKLKRLIINANKNKHFDYLVFGSSRCMTMSQKLTGANLLNLGVSGATIQDFLSLLEICKENNITYDNVIVSIDPGLLNSNNIDKRWLTNKDSFAKIAKTNIEEDKTDRTLIKTLLSGSYFQSSIIDILKYGISDRLIIAEKEENEEKTIFPDGSITYGEVYRCTPQDQIDKYANNPLRQEFSSFAAISDEYKNLFNLFLSEVADKGQNVTFITYPYLKGYYENLIAVNGVKQQVTYLNDLAKQKNYKNYGSLNPTAVGVTNKDFYDELHLRRETIAKLCIEYDLFNGTKMGNVKP